MSAEIRKMRRTWRKYSKIPKLYSKTELTVPPDHQFVQELIISLGSWDHNARNKFIEVMDGTPKVCVVNGIREAREIVLDVLDVWDDGRYYQCSRRNIDEFMG